MRSLKLLTRLAFCSSALFVSQIAPTRAAVEMFLKLDGIKGESKDSKFKDQIDIESFSWGLAKDAASEAASFTDLTLGKRVDAASPKIMLQTANGKNIPKAVLTFRTVRNRTEVEFKRIVLEEVTLTGILIGMSEPGGHESISLNYARIGVEYFTIAGERTEFAWDLKANQAGGVTFPGQENPDADNDGLPDDWERRFGLNTELNDASLDFDEDGATNIEEFQAGMNPASKNEVFRSLLAYTPGARVATLTWTSVPGRTYQILGGGDIGSPLEVIQTVPAAAEGGTTSFSVPFASALNQFFRVKVEPPPAP